MNVLERTQYQAALAVSGTWKGTNRNKIYEELGWETLDQRRFFRRLTHIYKIMNNLTPEDLKMPIPPQQGHLFGYRSSNVIRPIACRTERYRNSFYPDSVISWNGIGPELRGAKSLSIFKKNILKIIRPMRRSIFGIHNPKGIGWIFQLRVGLSSLKSHKKSHNFQDTPDDECICNYAETTQHFLLKCHIYEENRFDLFQTINPILLANDMYHPNDSEIINLLLYGDERLQYHTNQTVLKETINFIEKSLRFSQT